MLLSSLCPVRIMLMEGSSEGFMKKKHGKESVNHEEDHVLFCLLIRRHVHTGFQIRGQGLIFIPRNLCCADVLSSRISPLRAGSPKPGKQDERFCFPLLLPTYTFFHKQLFFRIIELLEPDLAGIPPYPTGSMRSWDNSLFIHAESGISQSNLEFAMTGSFAR